MSKRLVRCVDFETTGLSAMKGAEVIEVGITDIHYTDADNIEIHYKGAWLCKPGCPIEYGAMAVHHIKEEDVENAPYFQDIIDEHVVHPAVWAYVAHHAQFEAQFWSPPKPWIDTLKVARRLYPDFPEHKNQYLRYALHLDSDPGFDIDLAMPPHRAGPDAYVTAFLTRRCLQKHDVIELVKLTHEPQLLEKVHFGRNKGKPWKEADISFLKWVVDNPQAEPDVKFTAQYWLQQRTGQSPQSASQPATGGADDFIVDFRKT